jgi:hypothetical protein
LLLSSHQPTPPPPPQKRSLLQHFFEKKLVRISRILSTRREGIMDLLDQRIGQLEEALKHRDARIAHLEAYAKELERQKQGDTNNEFGDDEIFFGSVPVHLK